MTGRRDGFTLVEVTVAAAVVAVALIGLVGSLVLAVKQSALAADTATAVDGARRQVETMSAQPFRRIFPLYNAYDGDDPLGWDTGPGTGFDVAGLTPRAGDPDGRVGRVIMPAAGTDGRNLRENLTMAELDMPRDLDADGAIDGLDKEGRYALLPATIVVEWRGVYGDASVRVNAIFAQRGEH